MNLGKNVRGLIYNEACNFPYYSSIHFQSSPYWKLINYRGFNLIISTASDFMGPDFGYREFYE